MLGYISSIATLVLFVIYFIGRIITIIMVKPIWSDKITNYDSATDIVEEYEIDDTGCKAALTTTNGIRNLKIYAVEFDPEIGIVHSTKELLYERAFLNIGQSIVICADLPDCIPKILVEYETLEYMKVSIAWVDNCKNGVMSEIPTLTHTVKSILYYLCR